VPIRARLTIGPEETHVTPGSIGRTAAAIFPNVMMERVRPAE
jgi:hypothetical protein